MVMSRPLISRLLSRLITKFCRRLKKLARWKKLPASVKVNCSVGRPACPTVAPGGSCDAAATDALLGVPELDPVLDGVLDVVAPPDPPASCSPRKLTWAACAALCTW